jgi:hypothetical protein
MSYTDDAALAEWQRERATAARAELGDLTLRLRALRLPDEAMIVLEVGSVRERQCGPSGAIRVTARKGDVIETVEALHLEDALLMVRAHIDRAIKASAEKAAEKRKSALPAESAQ